MKHTKGPWKITVHADKETWENTYRISYQDFLIAETYINKANATLIAAAPEMLEALDYLFHNVELKIPSAWNDKILNAIKKAKGDPK